MLDMMVRYMVFRRATRSVLLWSLISNAFSSCFSSSSSLSSLSSSLPSPSLPSPRISAFVLLYSSSFSSHSGSNLKIFRPSSTSISSSKAMTWVIWSSSSTKSSSSLMAGLSLYLSFRTWKRTSIIYCTLLSISASCNMLRNWSKTARAIAWFISSRC